MIVKENTNLTCFSCLNWTKEACKENEEGWPTKKLDECFFASYEPGSDEQEENINE